MMEETPGWMGFRSSIDGFNVNQNPSTGPGGAQDHQEPVYYSNGQWPTGTGGTMARCVLWVCCASNLFHARIHGDLLK